MKYYKFLILTVILFALILLPGCHRQLETNIHQPGVYKHELPQVGPSKEYLAMKAERNGNFHAAKQYYLAWLSSKPSDHDTWFRFACLLSKMDNHKLAALAIDRAIDAGFKDQERLDRQEELDPVRNTSEFKSAYKKMLKIISKSAVDNTERHYISMESVGTYITLLPPDYHTSSKNYPVCLVLHGSDLNEDRYAHVVDKLVRDDVVYVIPRAPFVTPNAFKYNQPGYSGWPTYSIPKDHPIRNNRERFHIAWVMKCLEDAKTKYRIASNQQYILGHSMGAAFTYMIAATHPKQFQSILCYAGYYFDDYQTPTVLEKLKAHKISIYLVHGEDDHVVPKDYAESLYSTLIEHGINAYLNLQPCKHRIDEPIYHVMRQWINQTILNKDLSASLKVKR
ncbi:alpha/beta hydrolase-fold protein [Poriferisphaera sp. WC338]|uniref:alpha/beta hydrolase-fold protein n=1 Tax=Poriferisphaera sp. WC338 TaxID=3425129 RepID=UPI003D814D70